MRGALLELLRRVAGVQEGSLRMMSARLLLLLACAAPAGFGARSAVDDGYAEVPRLVARAADPTLSMLLGAMQGLGGWVLGLLLVGLVVWIIVERVLTGTALGILSPPETLSRQADPEVDLRVAMRRYGWARLGALLRLFGWSVAVTAVGFWLLDLVFESLADSAVRDGTDGVYQVMTLPGLRLLTSLAWVSIVGALVWWAKAAIVADGRRRAWRTARIAIGVARQAPGAFVTAWVLLFASQVLGLAVLLQWLPGQGGALVWLAWLLWQTWLWHGLARLTSQTYQSDRCVELRMLTDQPLLRRTG